MGEEVNNQQEQVKKYSYEELENICHQLSEQARNLYIQLQEANLNNMYTRLNFLFKVLENQISFEPKFVEDCSNEIVTLMAIKEQDDKEESKSE